MDAIFGSLGLPIWIVLGLAAVLAAFLYFGKRGGQIAGVVVAAVLTFLAIRKDAKDDANQARTTEDLENERTRNERIVAADRAGDSARNVPDDRLRDDDPFRID